MDRVVDQEGTTQFSTRPTTLMEKAIASVVNIGAVFILSFPAFLAYGAGVKWRIVFIVMAAVYQVFVAVPLKDRCLGLRLLGARWDREPYPVRNRLIFNVLYFLHDASFALWIIFPFDAFLFNIFFLQLPFLLKTGNTVQGWMSGFWSVK